MYVSHLRFKWAAALIGRFEVAELAATVDALHRETLELAPAGERA